VNPEQQRIAIAEACGWTAKEDKDGFWRAVDRFRNMTHKLWISESNVWSAGIPDYLNDLNAMHKAEEVLTPEQLVEYCAFRLRAVTGQGCVTDYKMIRATASQRAEAFLRTIGKWEEAKP